MVARDNQARVVAATTVAVAWAAAGREAVGWAAEGAAAAHPATVLGVVQMETG